MQLWFLLQDFMRIKLLPAFTLLMGLLGMVQPAAAQNYVCMETTLGNICMQLLPESAPLTVANFLKYVNDGDYTNSLIHRTVPGFIIQGGSIYGLASNLGSPVPTDPPVKNEFSKSNLRGTVAMAKVADNPNSATSQWFINLADNSANLDAQNSGFTVFANIVLGMDLADKIAGLPLGNIGGGNIVPINVPPTATQFTVEDLVLVKRAYATTTLPGSIKPYQCSAASVGDTFTEFCGTYLSFPVAVDGVLYEATLNLSKSSPNLVFTVDRSKLKSIANTGQERAVFNSSTGILTLPSVRSGANAFNNVLLLLTNTGTLEFTLKSFVAR